MTPAAIVVGVLVLNPVAATAQVRPTVASAAVGVGHAALPTASSDDLGCPVNFGAHQGLRLCPTRDYEYLYANWTMEVFVVGTDHSVWHTWQNPDDHTWHEWTSLGGVAIDGVWPHGHSGDGPSIEVIGSDNNLWCDNWGTTWSGWYRC